MILFLDTNVILDATHPARANQQDAQALLNEISRRNATGYLASFSIATITYFLQKAFRQNTSVLLGQILAQLEIVDLNKQDFLNALLLPFRDLEDAYQYVAATKVAGVDCIVTQNARDFKHSTIPVMKASDVLKML